VKITVLNGSPKGNNSVTMSYIKYLQARYPEHDFNIKTVALSIPRLEKDTAAFQELIAEIRESDAIIWAFPLYFMLVHSHYKRFIELIWERKAENVFQGKYAISFSTSIHFYDHTAHNYIHAICDDLGMHFVSSFSSEMHDLMEKQKRLTWKHISKNSSMQSKIKPVYKRVFLLLLPCIFPTKWVR
jgi:NAD(P)H-dependent FMN reductase